MKDRPIIPIILAGGTGSRLWPLSRQSFPKQFLSLNSNNEKTLLQNTQERISKIKNIRAPILICNEQHRFIVAEQMNNINIKPLSILLEPIGRNTAPAIAVAALKAIELEDDPHILIMSSDHQILNPEKFLKTIEEGIKYSEKDRLVTFGVIPNKPETGYGYIKSKNPLNKNKIIGESVLSFLEKPNLETAKKFIKDKRYSWNSGIFLFKAKKILSQIEEYNPEINNFAKESLIKKISDLDFERLDRESFESCPNISIDFAVMEKTDKGTVLPLDVEWSDIGSWESVWESSIKNDDGNVIKGNVISKDNKNCYLRSESKLIVGMGLKNLILVETSDAILIAEKSYSQKVKNIVEDLKNRSIKEGQNHQKIYRPWGNYESIADDATWKVKLITVKPGNSLSLQMHHHRAEHWIIVKGTAKVQINDKNLFLCENQSTFIPLGSKHRLTNPGKIPLILIEVQSGTYLEEDDIKRFEDNYGRI